MEHRRRRSEASNASVGMSVSEVRNTRHERSEGCAPIFLKLYTSPKV